MISRRRRRKFNSDKAFYDCFDIGSALLLGGTSLLGSVVGGLFNRKNNKENVQLQKETNSQSQANWQQEFDYTKYLNALQMQREDNAVQRLVSDAQSAGLSPLAVANTGGASSGAVMSPPSAPNLTAPQVMSSGGIIQQGFSGLSNAMLQLDTNSTNRYIADENTKSRLLVESMNCAKDIAIAQEQFASNERINQSALENARLIAETGWLNQSYDLTYQYEQSLTQALQVEQGFKSVKFLDSEDECNKRNSAYISSLTNIYRKYGVNYNDNSRGVGDVYPDSPEPLISTKSASASEGYGLGASGGSVASVTGQTSSSHSETYTKDLDVNLRREIEHLRASTVWYQPRNTAKVQKISR